MNKSKREISLGFTEQKISEGSHICYIFNDDDERYLTMMKYLQSGAQENEKVLYLVDTEEEASFKDKIFELGFDIRKENSIFINQATKAYCPDGSFCISKMVENVKDLYLDSQRENFSGARISGEMSWALTEGVVKDTDLIEYEATINQILVDYPCTACCQYDARKFDGATILDILKVHPKMIIRGQVYSNPYYVEPEIFLQTLKSR